VKRASAAKVAPRDFGGGRDPSAKATLAARWRKRNEIWPFLGFVRRRCGENSSTARASGFRRRFHRDLLADRMIVGRAISASKPVALSAARMVRAGLASIVSLPGVLSYYREEGRLQA
jgi:hypothetical protein